MGFFERLFGGGEEPQPQQRPMPRQNMPGRQQGHLTDEQAIERYRYMLRTAPPETIEQAHAEAFAQLTPEQRRMVLQQLRDTLPEFERQAADQYGDDPRSLARMATRAEMRQPGTLERSFSAMPGVSMGGLMAGSFLSSLAGVFLGTMIAQSFFGGHSGYEHGYGEGYQTGYDEGQDQSAEYRPEEGGGEEMGADYGHGDYGGDFGGFGGDFGGGDF